IADFYPDLWQCFSEINHLRKFILLTDCYPVRMINILFPAFVIKACGLKMTVAFCTDPDIFPGRRDSKGINPFDGIWIFYSFTVKVIIIKQLAPFLAEKTRLTVRTIAQ